MAAFKKRRKPKACLQCGQYFIQKSPEQKFCGRSCSASFNNIAQGMTGPKCPTCNKHLGRDQQKNKYGFCSKYCRMQEDEKRWLQGIDDGNGKYAPRSVVRRWLDRQRGRTCWQCDIVSFRPEVSKVLQLDHIDGNWENCRPENLRLLCPNCHALTDTYGSKNRGRGRSWKHDYKQYGEDN